jgi:hypothetical protein
MPDRGASFRNQELALQGLCERVARAPGWPDSFGPGLPRDQGLKKASEEVYRPEIFLGPPASSRMTIERKMENTQCPA